MPSCLAMVTIVASLQNWEIITIHGDDYVKEAPPDRPFKRIVI